MHKREIEARLERYAQGFDDRVPRRPDFERRIIARASAQPIRATRRLPIIRELALAALVVLLVSSLGFGVVQLRSLRQATTVKSPKPSASASPTPTARPAPTLGPTLTYTPGLRLLVGPIELGSVYTGMPLKMMTPLRGWAVGPPGKDRAQAHDAVLITEDAGAHWRNVTPPGFSGWTDRTMSFLDLTHAWVAVTPHVVAHPAATPATITVFRTSDGANSWQSATFQLADGSPSQLDFIDQQHGWMVLQVNNGIAIYRTSDGGIHWEPASVSTYTRPNETPPGVLPMSSASGPNRDKELSCVLDPFAAIAFRDASTGWATGSCRGPLPSAYVYVTHDAGGTWQPQALPTLPDMSGCPCGIAATGPVFTSSRDATLTMAFNTEETKCHTENGGTACATQSIPGTVMIDVTHDGGQTWASHTLPGVASWRAEPSFIDGRTGWYVASILKASPTFPGETTFDKLYVTHDSGASWSPVPATPGLEGGWIQFISSTTGWALYPPSLITTTDGGRSWQPLNPVVTG